LKQKITLLVSEKNMDLSPNDIRNYEFNNQMRGYDKEEVNSFLEQVATALENLKQENLKLSMEADSLKTQLAGLRQFEDTIKSAAIDARRNADMTVENAKKEAELILSQAKAEADKIIGSRADQLNQYHDQISKLELAKQTYVNKLRHLIKSHLELVNEIAEDDPTAATKTTSSIEVTESTEVTREKLETIADKPSASEPIKTEEANAPEKIVKADTPPAPPVDSTPEPAETKPQPTDTKPQPEIPVDPELAAALEKYQKQAQASPPQTSPEPQPTPAPAPPPIGKLVETEARAEDVPEGFIAGNNEPPDKSSTDKVPVPENNPQELTEHNAIDIDKQNAEQQNINPDVLAQELDRVAEKFEEEMNKAAKA